MSVHFNPSSITYHQMPLPSTLEERCDQCLTLLKLEEKLGHEIRQKIDEMPIWNGQIQYSDEEKDFLRLSQFPEQNVEDRQNHFFKTIIDGDLHLILITANRFDSKVIRFNSGFNIDSSNPKEFLYRDYSLGISSGYYVDTNDNPHKKQDEYNSGWASMKNTLCRLLDVHFEATNLQELNIEFMNAWIKSIRGWPEA